MPLEMRTWQPKQMPGYLSQPRASIHLQAQSGLMLLDIQSEDLFSTLNGRLFRSQGHINWGYFDLRFCQQIGTVLMDFILLEQALCIQ